MERLLWTKYKKGEINDKIEYWVDYWQDLIDTIKNKGIEYRLVSPTSLLIEIQDEIIYNELKNKSNINYYKKQLGLFLNKDIIIKKYFSSDFKLLLKEFDNKRITYFAKLCEDLKMQLKKDKYFHKNCNELKNILLNKTWETEDKSKIGQISKNLIVELMLIGYSLDTLRGLPIKFFYYMKNEVI